MALKWKVNINHSNVCLFLFFSVSLLTLTSISRAHFGYCLINNVKILFRKYHLHQLMFLWPISCETRGIVKWSTACLCVNVLSCKGKQKTLKASGHIICEVKMVKMYKRCRSCIGAVTRFDAVLFVTNIRSDFSFPHWKYIHLHSIDR